MKIDIKPHTRIVTEQTMNDSYDPKKESFRWVSVADLMSLKNILENYKYHTLKEIEDIIGYGQDVFEIKDRSDILIEIEDGLNMIEECLHPKDSEKTDKESPFVLKESDIKADSIIAGDSADIKPFTIKLNIENIEEDKDEDKEDNTEKEGDINKESLLNTLKDIIDALCNRDSNDEDDYTWYLNKDLWKKANARNARNLWTDPDKKETLNPDKKKIVKEIKWVEDRIGDDGVPKSISIEKKADGIYEVWLIRAENEPDAIRKLKTCETLDDALDFVEKHYIGKIYQGTN